MTPPEKTVDQILRAIHFPCVFQFCINDQDGIPSYYDFGNREAKLIIEVDSRSYHGKQTAIRKDSIKTKLAVSKGFMVARVHSSLPRSETKARVLHAVSQATYKSYVGTPCMDLLLAVDQILDLCRDLPDSKSVLSAPGLKACLSPHTLSVRWVIVFLAEWKRCHPSYRMPYRQEFEALEKLLTKQLTQDGRKALVSSMIAKALDVAANPPEVREGGFLPYSATAKHALNLLDFCTHYPEIAKELGYGQFARS